MNFLETEINVGASTPFQLLHMSDTHLSLADSRNDQRKIDLANNRRQHFSESTQMLTTAHEKATEYKCPIIHTGDLIDFVSYANLDAAKEFTDRNDVFMAAGNHEFSLYVGEAFEDAAYRNQSLSLVQGAFKNNIRFSSRIINGVDLIAVDNSYYLIDEEQLVFLQQELSKNMPSLLLLHTPLYSEGLYDYIMNVKKNTDAALMNVPSDKMTMYNDYRLRQQSADETTKTAYSLIVNSKNIKAIIAGHLHFNYEDHLTNNLPQYITDCTTLRLISCK